MSDEKDPSAGPDTRLNLYLRGVAHIEYPEDVAAIRRAVPEVAMLSNSQIQDLYHTYGEDEYCASWLMLEYANLDDFRRWLTEEVSYFNADKY